MDRDDVETVLVHLPLGLAGAADVSKGIEKSQGGGTSVAAGGVCRVGQAGGYLFHEGQGGRAHGWGTQVDTRGVWGRQNFRGMGGF